MADSDCIRVIADAGGGFAAVYDPPAEVGCEGLIERVHYSTWDEALGYAAGMALAANCELRDMTGRLSAEQCAELVRALYLDALDQAARDGVQLDASLLQRQ